MSQPQVPPHFFAVSVVKLAVMSLATAGLYQVYWFYRHWQVIKTRTGEPLSAPLRALFHVFFAYPLFRRISADGTPGQVSPLLLALVFVAVGVATLMPLREPWTFVGLLAVLPLLEIQSQANQVNERLAPQADPNRTFTWANVLGLAVGAAAWTLIIASLVDAHRDPGSALNLYTAAADARRGLPRTTADGVQLIEVADEPRQLTYGYLVADAAAAPFHLSPFREDTRRARVRDACGRPELRRLLDAGVKLRHIYRSRSNESLLEVTVAGPDCRSAEGAT